MVTEVEDAMGRRTPPRARPPGKGDVGTGAVMLVFFLVAVVVFSALGWIDDLAVPLALPLMICLDVSRRRSGLLRGALPVLVLGFGWLTLWSLVSPTDVQATAVAGTVLAYAAGGAGLIFLVRAIGGERPAET